LLSLTTCVDIIHPALAGKAAGVIHSDSWPTHTNLDFFDSQGHGTHVAGLLLKVAPTAELYIAKLDDSSEAEFGWDVGSYKVAKVNRI
jgi:hypothetical protein